MKALFSFTPPAAMRGGALVIAMLVAALAAAVAVSLISDEQRWLGSVEARRDQAQAQALANAGVQWARHILFQDAQQSDIDHLRESWAFPLPPTPIENGLIEGQIIDLQSRINLNNLLPDSALRRSEIQRLDRLCTRLGISDAARQALFARFGGRDTGNSVSVSIGSNARPSTVSSPALFDVGELPLPTSALSRLLPHLTALPTATPLNINTAGRETLRASLPEISDEALDRLLELRMTAPFQSVADFRRRLPDNLSQIDEKALSVSSRYFLVTVRARQGEARATAQALLHREARRWPEIVWKTVE